ncbi:MAG TPA: exo-alpha-sialidase [Gemmatimonadetes bacterium]|nr:exo-alpha-sialidase [Gemmatimonadota bacterium]
MTLNGDGPEELELRGLGAGRALLVRPDGRLYISRGYSVYQSDDDGASWSFVATAPTPLKRWPGHFLRLAARLLRFEIRALVSLADDGLVAANRDWVYYTQPGERMMQRSRVDEGAQPLVPPFNMTEGPDGRVLFGEYNAQLHHGNPVRVYASDDGGKSFEVAHCFEGGDVMHVHRLLYDPGLDHYWLFTGDFDDEVGIGILSRDLQHFEWLVRGEQKFRVCEAFDFGDRLVYATDTPFEQNSVISLDKSTGRTEKLIETGGSCLYAARFGDLCVFSTTVETLSVDTAKSIELVVSRDGDRWSSVLEAEKDLWHPSLFQFGSLILPRGTSRRETVFFSGQAVKQYDGKVFAGKFS